MTKMAAMLIYGKNLQKSNRPRYQVSVYRTIGPLVLNKIFFFEVMTKQTLYRYSADSKEIIQNTHDFCKRGKEDGLKISLNQVKERAPTATGVSKSMIERIIRRDKATEQKPCSLPGAACSKHR